MNRWRNSDKKYNGPPKKATFPMIGRPQAKPPPLVALKSQYPP